MANFRHKIMKVLRLFLSFSYDGEDKMFLDLLPEKGTYLSIGAHHPVKASNTMLLYLRGWKGTNIDIINKWKFKLLRPRDKFIYGYIEANISYFFPHKLFTSDYEIARDRIIRGWQPITRKVPQHSITEFTGYTLLDLDVDGIETTILKKLLPYYNPPFVCVENVLEEQKGVDAILFDAGYVKVAQTLHNGIFKRGIE